MFVELRKVTEHGSEHSKSEASESWMGSVRFLLFSVFGAFLLIPQTLLCAAKEWEAKESCSGSC